ncbi:MAG: TraX family protein [Bacilli bacterium]|nr:TraX family protein [Bacillales bacterium]MDY2575032.1 TraX family protein [Bacilli bacterium]
MENKKGISSLSLKIIGLITMTLDHFGRMAKVFFDNQVLLRISNICIIIGRISFPIFAFLIVEGVIHTKNKLNYLLRLLILSIFCDLTFYLISHNYWGNPITTLFLGALTISLLENKKLWVKLSSIIPITLTILIAFEVIPILSMYDLYGLVLILLFYFSIYLSKILCKIISNYYQLDYDLAYSKYYFSIRKYLSCFFLISFNILIWFINPTVNNINIFIDDPISQLYSLLSIPFIILYNGEKGYSNKVIKYSFYLYFPLHLAILYLLMHLFS